MRRAVLFALTTSCTFRLAEVVDGVDATPRDSGVVIEASCSPDLNTDSLHCGRCSHSCLGGACVAGLCQAINLTVPIASPGGIALDDTHVFWTSTTTGDIFRANKDGTAPLPLGAQKDALSIAVSGGGLAYSAPTAKVVGFASTQEKKPLVTVATDQGVNWGYVAIDDAFVYWADPVAGTVSRSSRTAPKPVELASGEKAPHSVFLDRDTILWTTAGGELIRARKDGSARAVIASGLGTPTHLATMADTAFVTDTSAGTIARVSLTNGEKAVIITGQSDAHGLIVEGTTLYWSSGPLMQFDGKTVSVFNESGNVHRIAADSTAVYWTEFGGSVKRKAK